MIPSLSFSNSGQIENNLSGYAPSQEIKELLGVALIDEQVGDEILNRPFEEFNNMSLIQRANLDQKDWLAWSEDPSTNPDESWMFTGTSAITRNKIISTAAHLTRAVIYPKVFAQNDEDEEDEGAAYIMENAIEYNCRRNNYEQTFLYAVISGLVNPVSYYKVDYGEAYQEILEGTASAYTKKKVLDEILSGFQNALLPLDEVLLANPYCFNTQKQPFIIQRRRIPYGEAKMIYGNHSNFVSVKPGLAVVQNSTNGLFYDVNDIGDGMVEEAIFKYRGRDVEFSRINGIYMSNPNVDYLPMKHRDNQNRPKYNVVKYGAEPIDAMRFAYYKSLAAKLSNDKELVDRMRQNAVDASTFATFPSIFTMGAGKLDRSVFVPATIVDLNKDAKVSPASGLANPSYAYQAAREAEQRMAETSLDPQLSGISSGVDKTAREAVLLQQNAISNLGIIGRMLAQGMIAPIGELMIDNIIRYQTIGEVRQLAGGALGMKYLTMILNDKIKDGGKKTIVIRFTDVWAGRKFSEQAKNEKNLTLFQEAGDSKEIWEVNPALLAKRKYLIVVEPDILLPKNDSFERTFKIEVYDRAINNPLIANDPDKLADITRDFLFEPTVKGESAKYIPRDTQRVLNGLIPSPYQPKAGIARQVVRNNALSNLPELVK